MKMTKKDKEEKLKKKKRERKKGRKEGRKKKAGIEFSHVRSSETSNFRLWTSTGRN